MPTGTLTGAVRDPNEMMLPPGWSGPTQIRPLDPFHF